MPHTIRESLPARNAQRLVGDAYRRGNPMHSRITRLLVVAAAAVAVASPADAQYFGRNKVQYEQFDWRILKSDHFDLFFYPAESLKVADAGRQSERWYA